MPQYPATVPLQKPPRSRVGAFAVSGAINTMVDFLVLNAGLILFGLPLLIANVISVSAALCVSYFLNNNWVFKGHKTGSNSVLLFIGITLFGVYILQSIVILVLSGDRTVIAQGIQYSLGLAGLESGGFIEANIAKILATVVSSIWNFLMYRRFVFKDT